MQTSDGPTNPRTGRVLKNRQVNSGIFTPHTVSPMQHLQAVIVRKSKPLGFCFGEQESEPYPRTQMSDRPTYSSHTFLKLFLNTSKLAGTLGKKSSIISRIFRGITYNVLNKSLNELSYCINTGTQ